MKLTVQCVHNNGARLGSLIGTGQHGDYRLATPLCMLYTRGGSAPHLSSAVLSKCQGVPEVAHMPVNLLAHYQETIEGYHDGMAKFAALGDKLVYTSLHDPAVEVKAGCNDRASVGVLAKHGRVKLDIEGFMKLQESILPDWFQCLSDGDTQRGCSRKRAQKAVDRTLNFLDEILEKYTKSKRMCNSKLFGCIVGGYHLEERLRCTHETVARNVDGFVIEGFHNMGPPSENFVLDENTQAILSEVIKLLPEDKPRLMQAVWRPDNVLYALEMGIDIFDSSYPYIVTERGHALTFMYNFRVNPESNELESETFHGFNINLHDKRYFDDFSPLLKDCTCYACQNFTRAYVNHLLNTSELLASTILMIHNFHHYFMFFQTIREALAENRLEELKQLIIKQVFINKDSNTGVTGLQLTSSKNI